MKMVVGLGNPGPQYEVTRHNVGFLAIDRLVERWNASGPVSKFQGETYQAQVGNEKVCLVKPLTFMNVSGQCVGPLFHFYRCRPEDLIVIHDDLDLPPLFLRLKTGGGTGGHNGLKSIDEHLGKDHHHYHRIRIGIGHPARLDPPLRISPADYVLRPLEELELKELDSLLDDVGAAAEAILENKVQNMMNVLHRKK